LVFVFRVGSLGDSLVSLPALHHIKKLHPKEKIILITNDPKKNYLSTWNIVKYADVFDDLMTYDGSRISSVMKLIKNIRRIKEEKTLYYLPPFRTEKQVKRDKLLFSYLAGIEKVIGLDTAVARLAGKDKEGKLLTLEKEYTRLLKVVLNEKDSLNNFLPNTPLLKPSLENYKQVQKLLHSQIEDEQLIAIAHGTNMQAKKWELENFKELMKLLNKSYENLTFVLVGGKEDFNEGEKLREEIENCINLAGKTSIIESAVLLEKCDLFIGNDTGTMHLASVMGTPVIGIFSARDNPGKWEPYGENNITLRKEVKCEGCMLVECIYEDKKCIKMIDVNDVFNVTKQFIEK